LPGGPGGAFAGPFFKDYHLVPGRFPGGFDFYREERGGGGGGALGRDGDLFFLFGLFSPGVGPFGGRLFSSRFWGKRRKKKKGCMGGGFSKKGVGGTFCRKRAGGGNSESCCLGGVVSRGAPTPVVFWFFQKHVNPKGKVFRKERAGFFYGEKIKGGTQAGGGGPRRSGKGGPGGGARLAQSLWNFSEGFGAGVNPFGK